MDETPSRPQHLFIVRMWSETPQPGPWRGSVEHVATGQKLFFTSLGDLNDFITLRLVLQPHSLPIAKETK